MSRSLKTRPWRPKTTPRRSIKSESSKSFNSSRASACFEKSTASSFLNASSSCAAQTAAASTTRASAASARLTLSCVFDIGGTLLSVRSLGDFKIATEARRHGEGKRQKAKGKLQKAKGKG